MKRCSRLSSSPRPLTGQTAQPSAPLASRHGLLEARHRRTGLVHRPRLGLDRSRGRRRSWSRRSHGQGPAGRRLRAQEPSPDRKAACVTPPWLSPSLAPRLTSLTLALLPTLGRRRRPPLPPRAAPRRRPPVPDRHGQEHPAPAVPPRGRLGKGGQEHRRHAAPTVRPSPSCKLSQVYVELTRGSVHAESPPSRSRSVSQKRSAASSATRCALRLPPNLPARASFVS